MQKNGMIEVFSFRFFPKKELREVEKMEKWATL